MANGWYLTGLDAFAKGEVAWLTDDIRAFIVDAQEYSAPNLSTDQFLDDIPAGGIVAMSDALASKTVANGGELDSALANFAAVSGDPSEHIIIAKWTGSNATSQMLLFYDTATGLTVTPNGGGITVTPSASPNYWGKL